MNMNIIQYDDGQRPIYAKAIAQVKESIPSGSRHTLISGCGYEVRNGDYRAASEIVRLSEASTNPDMLWLDSDCLIKKWPDFEWKPGKPYMSERWLEAVFYVNGCCEFFSDMLKASEKYSHKPCWLRKMFQDRKKYFEMIPDGYFVHMAFSTAILAGKSFANCGNRDYKLYRDSNGELQFDIRF